MCDNNIVIIINDIDLEIAKIKFQDMFGTNVLKHSRLVIWNPDSDIPTVYYTKSGFSYKFCFTAKNYINDETTSSIIINGIELRCFIEFVKEDEDIEYCEFKDAIKKCLKS